jgi:hypothetical protein
MADDITTIHCIIVSVLVTARLRLEVGAASGLSYSEMAPQTIGVAQNGLEKGAGSGAKASRPNVEASVTLNGSTERGLCYALSRAR